MPRLCIVARSELRLYGYLLVALERELLDDRMRITFDRRQPAPPPGAAPPGVERRTHLAVEEVLRTQGYVIVDENGDVAAPEKLPAWREAARLGTSAAGWAGERARSTWQAAGEWVRSTWQARPATGTVAKYAGVLGALAISAVLVAAHFSTRADRGVVLPDAESRVASAPSQTARAASPPRVIAPPPAPVVGPLEPEAGSVTSGAPPPEPAVFASALKDQPPAVAAPPAPVVGPPEPEAGSVPLGASAPEPAVLANAQKDRPTAPQSTPSRAAALRPAAAPVTTPVRTSVPTRVKPTVALEADAQGKGTQRSITYTASVLDASGQPVTNAKVWLLAWMPPDASDLTTPLAPTDTPGTYQGRIEVGVFTPGNLRVRVAHGEKSFDIAPQHRRR